MVCFSRRDLGFRGIFEGPGGTGSRRLVSSSIWYSRGELQTCMILEYSYGVTESWFILLYNEDFKPCISLIQYQNYQQVINYQKMLN